MWRRLETMWLWIIKALSRRRVIDGVTVFVYNLEERPDLVFGKVESALALLTRYDPVRDARFRSGFDTILVNDAEGRLGSAHIGRRLCKLDERYVVSDATTPEALAGTLVHEGTHAYIASKGVSYRAAYRRRVEGVCYSAEIAFLRRLPVWIPRLARAAFSKRNYGPEEYTQRRVDQLRVELLRRIGTPSWMVKVAEHRANRMAARHGT